MPPVALCLCPASEGGAAGQLFRGPPNTCLASMAAGGLGKAGAFDTQKMAMSRCGARAMRWVGSDRTAPSPEP